jgi:hypothetical protein
MNSYRKSNTRRALGFPVSTSANASFTCSSLHTFVITLVSCRLELKRLSQIDSTPQNRSHYFDNACHDVKNRKCTCWSAGSPTNTAVPPRRRDPKGLFKCFRRNSCAIAPLLRGGDWRPKEESNELGPRRTLVKLTNDERREKKRQT